MKMTHISNWSSLTLGLIIIILKWCWSICAYYITNIRDVWDSDLLWSNNTLSRRSVCIDWCSNIHVVLSTLIWTIWIIWVIWMIRWKNSIMVRVTLCEARIYSPCCSVLLIIVSSRCISLFSWLRTYTS